MRNREVGPERDNRNDCEELCTACRGDLCDPRPVAARARILRMADHAQWKPLAGLAELDRKRRCGNSRLARLHCVPGLNVMPSCVVWRRGRPTATGVASLRLACDPERPVNFCSWAFRSWQKRLNPTFWSVASRICLASKFLSRRPLRCRRLGMMIRRAPFQA